MPVPDRSPSQQLLDEMHGIREGLDRLSSSIEELTEVFAIAANIELEDAEDAEDAEDVDGAVDVFGGSQVGQAMGGLGKAVFEWLRTMQKGR